MNVFFPLYSQKINLCFLTIFFYNEIRQLHISRHPFVQVKMINWAKLFSWYSISVAPDTRKRGEVLLPFPPNWINNVLLKGCPYRGGWAAIFNIQILHFKFADVHLKCFVQTQSMQNLKIITITGTGIWMRRDFCFVWALKYFYQEMFWQPSMNLRYCCILFMLKVIIWLFRVICWLFGVIIRMFGVIMRLYGVIIWPFRVIIRLFWVIIQLFVVIIRLYGVIIGPLRVIIQLFGVIIQLLESSSDRLESLSDCF